MMRLETKDIRDILDKGKSEQLEKACRLQAWGEFFATFTRQLESECGYYQEVKKDFFNEVKNRLPEEKANRYIEYFKNDLPAILFDVEREYQRAHNAQDRHISFQYTDEAKTQALEKWLSETKVSYRLKVEGSRRVIRGINSFVIVLPNPSPFLWLNVKQVVYCHESEGKVDSIVFYHKGLVYVVDTVSYRIFSRDGRGMVLEQEIAHGLDYAPVCYFWHSDYFDGQTIKESPIYPAIDKAFRFLDHQNGKDYYDAYAKYEILKLRSERCDYIDPIYGGECSGGYVSGRVKHYEDGTFESMPDASCPRCTSKRMIGAGSIIEVPTPADPAINNWEAIERIGADVPTLQYNTDETNRLTRDLVVSLIGIMDGAINSEAINEEQVAALLEKKNSILLYLASNFEKTHKFIIDTSARLLYSSGYIGSIVKYGSQFFIKSENYLSKQYAEAKTSGFAQYQLAELQKQIDRKASENNAQLSERLIILRNIEPLPQLSIAEATDLRNIGTVSDFMLLKKSNLQSYIERFERENGELTKYAILQEDFGKRIDAINEIIDSYVNEDLTQTENNGENTATNPENTP